MPVPFLITPEAAHCERPGRRNFALTLSLERSARADSGIPDPILLSSFDTYYADGLRRFGTPSE
jgi:hypothetical protein